jgi:hypothetical protein
LFILQLVCFKFINFLKEIQIRLLFKKIIILFFVCFVFTGSAIAGDSLPEGDKSLLFQISEGSLHPRSFAGGIGFQFYTSERIVIRLPLGFGTYHELTEKPENTETDRIQNAWNFRFTPGLRYNFGKGHNVIAYTGVQLLFDYTDSTLTGENFKTNERTSSLYTWGLGLMLGAEWFPWRSLSFGLEYAPFLTFSGGQTTFKSGGFEQTDKLPKTTQFRTDFGSVLLIISFYFY